jgi:hypothetical protein
MTADLFWSYAETWSCWLAGGTGALPPGGQVQAGDLQAYLLCERDDGYGQHAEEFESRLE